MDSLQRCILIIAAIVIIIMAIFPPWQQSVLSHGAFNLGYHFVLIQPELSRGSGDSIASFINSKQLLVQWVGVIFVAGLLYFAAKK